MSKPPSSPTTRSRSPARDTKREIMISIDGRSLSVPSPSRSRALACWKSQRRCHEAVARHRQDVGVAPAGGRALKPAVEHRISVGGTVGAAWALERRSLTGAADGAVLSAQVSTAAAVLSFKLASRRRTTSRSTGCRRTPAQVHAVVHALRGSGRRPGFTEHRSMPSTLSICQPLRSWLKTAAYLNMFHTIR